MMDTQQIILKMKASVDGIRMKCHHTSSSHAFTTLYIWQEGMGLSIHLEDGMFAVKCRWRGENAWFFPCGEEHLVRRGVEELLLEKDLCLCYLREEDTAFLEREFPGRFLISEKECDHEYLYDRAEQVSLNGSRFSGLRKDIRRLEKLHRVSWEPLCSKNISDALIISRAWHRQTDGPEGLEDIAASERLLLEWDALDVQGVVASVDGEPYAIVAGYPLSPCSFDFSLSKEKSRLSGLSVYTRHALACSLSNVYTRINAEEDLGIEGLRNMKRLMRPDGQIKQYEGRAK